MKLFKKTAALLFCLALVFSVMAVSASADDEAELLEANAFNVQLVLTSSLEDKDGDTKYETGKSGTLTYNIQLAATTEASLHVDGFSFKVNAPNVTGATLTSVAPVGNLSTQQGTEDTTVWSFLSGSTSTDFVTNATAGKYDTIGTITFTLANATADTDFTPSISNISLTDRSVEDPATIAGPISADKVVKINPKYTITFTYKEADADGTTKDAASTPSGKTGSLDYYYSDGTGSYSGATFSAASLPDFDAITGYVRGTTHQWELTTLPSNYDGWADASKHNVGSAIAAGNRGDVTLTALYTPIDYTVTYTVGDENNPGEYTGAKTTYNIEQVSGVSDFFGLSTQPTRPGCTFVGWTAAGSANSAEETSDTYNAILNIATAFTTAPSFTGAYGDVEFTAVWKADGTAVTVDYAYAGKGNVLVLFTPTGTVQNGQTVYAVGDFKYAGSSMYKVATTKYKDAFTELTLADTAPIYAYIVATASYKDTAITYEKAETAQNTVVTYDGNVYNDTVINAGDFGNVLTMLDTQNDEFGFTTLTILSRLKADMDGIGTAYGSIEDAVEIAKLVGKTVTAETAS